MPSACTNQTISRKNSPAAARYTLKPCIESKGFSEVLRKPHRPPSDSLLLKSRADSIGTRRRVPRSYRYLTRGAVALALVINTVLYIAANALDVVATARITVVISHYNSTFTFPPRGIAATAILLELFQPTVVCAVRA